MASRDLDQPAGSEIEARVDGGVTALRVPPLGLDLSLLLPKLLFCLVVTGLAGLLFPIGAYRQVWREVPHLWIIGASAALSAFLVFINVDEALAEETLLLSENEVRVIRPGYLFTGGRRFPLDSVARVWTGPHGVYIEGARRAIISQVIVFGERRLDKSDRTWVKKVVKAHFKRILGKDLE